MFWRWHHCSAAHKSSFAISFDVRRKGQFRYTNTQYTFKNNVMVGKSIYETPTTVVNCKISRHSYNTKMASR